MSTKTKFEDIYGLTPLQKGMLFHALSSPKEALYFEQLTCELEGNLDVDAFERTWAILADRHSVLRTAFVWKGQREPVQVVMRQVSVPWERLDWRVYDEAAQEKKRREFLIDDRARGFQLNRAPLMRVTTVQLCANRWFFVWSHHHILMDGWSLPLLMKEFFALYHSICEGILLELPRTRPYGEFIAWLKDWNRDTIPEPRWRSYLKGFSSPNDFGFRVPGNSGEGFLEDSLSLSEKETEALQHLGQRLELTLNTLVQGAWALVVSRHSGRDDVAYGITVSGRPPQMDQAESIVGLFINTVPFRTLVKEDENPETFLRSIQERQLSMMEFEYSDLAEIHRWSDVPGDQSLFELLLVFENYPMGDAIPERFGGLSIRNVEFMERTNFPLTLIAIPGRELRLKVSFDSARLNPAKACRLLSHLKSVLNGFVQSPNSLAEIDMLDATERSFLLGLNGQAPCHTSKPGDLVSWFEQQVLQRGDATAIVHEGETLSYTSLNQRSNQLAHYLRGQGIKSESLVGIYLDRSLEMIIGILGILKAGGAYVPLDPAIPNERLTYIVEDSKIHVLLTQKKMLSEGNLDLGQVPLVCMDSALESIVKESAFNLDQAIVPNQPAYVIYTSGSTGKPKGCVISHSNVTRLFHSTDHWFQFQHTDVWTLFHSYAFDFSVWEIWGALLYGGRLVLVPYAVSRQPDAFHELLLKERVTVLNQTPSAFRQLMQSDAESGERFGHLRYVVFGGEALNPAYLKGWFDRYGDQQPKLINMYGITETTVHVTYYPLSKKDANDPMVGSPIGKAIPDLELFVLDPYGKFAPVGVSGELHVGGDGLALGYLHRPELTNSKFIDHPFSEARNARLYKTGDLARWSEEGDLEYLGRIDEQVKIRGFRIELGEIESTLARFPEISESLVLAKGGMLEDKRLAAYVVSKDGSLLSVETLRSQLKQWLPEYMIPSDFVFLKAFPLTENGKINRSELPDPQAARADLADNYIAPRTENERILCEVWSEVLKVDKVGIRDNYFALGGDSIRSITLLSLARERGVSFALSDLLEVQTIQDLLAIPATEVNVSTTVPFGLIHDKDRSAMSETVEDAYPLTQLQAGMLFHGNYSEDATAYQDVFTFHLKAPFDVEAMHLAVAGLASRHPILRTAFDLTSYSQPLQLIFKQIDWVIGVEDWSTLPVHALDATLKRWIESEKHRKINPGTTPLIRFHLHPREKGTFQFTLTFHHAILDGWSVATLLVELLQHYLNALKITSKPLPVVPSLTFRDFVKLEIEAVADEKIRKFWRVHLEDFTFNRVPRSASKSATKRVHRCDLNISAEHSQRIANIAKELGVSPKTIFLSIHARIIGLISGHTDVVTGLVSNGRPEESGGERITGLFLNTLPFRVELKKETWADLIQKVARIEQSYWPHRRMPLAEIQKIHNRSTLFETDFNYVHFHVYQSASSFSGVEFLSGQVEEETNFVLAANFSQDSETSQFEASLSLDLSVISPEHAEAIAGYYEEAIAHVSNQNAGSCVLNPLLTGKELDQTLHHWNQSTAKQFDPRSVHEIVQEQAALAPDSPALLDVDGKVVTFQALNDQANQWAHLLKAQGIGLESKVAVCLHRSPSMVIAILAILKVGAAYVPLDPFASQDRLNFILKDCQAEVCLTHTDLISTALKTVPNFYVDEPSLESVDDRVGNLSNTVTCDSLAYVIYTSGSTGQPKGVEISQGALSNHMQWMLETFPLTPQDRVLQKTSYCFDASVWEFWLPLMAGAPLVLAPNSAHLDVEDLVKSVQQHAITVLQVVPSLLDVLLQTPSFSSCSSLRRIFSGGEVLRIDLINAFKKLFPKTELINLYGPTEATIDSTFWKVPSEWEADYVPIGQTISNASAYVLDQELNPLPTWTVGDLYLGGAGLARGYSGQSGRTAASFIPNPFSSIPGDLLYRTGDRAYFRSDGHLVFCGRNDDQVKLRGFRIELGEIDAHLSQYPSVLQSVTVLNRESEHRTTSLISYIVLKFQKSATADDLKNFLTGLIPDYMVPSAIVFLSEWPLTSSGKIDKRALPKATAHSSSIVLRKIVKPSTDAESILTRIWNGVLHVENLSVDDNFFDLGGDSILSLQIVAKCAQAGWVITSKDIFELQTIQKVATRAHRVIGKKAIGDTPKGEVLLTPIQQAFFEQDLEAPHHWNQSILLKVPADFSIATLDACLNRLVEHHDSLRLRYERKAGNWRQFYTEEKPKIQIESIDLSGESEDEQSQSIESVGTRLQSGLNLTNGPVVQMAYFDCGSNKQGRLLTVIHHLVMDAVSWRILLEDLALLYGAGTSVEEVQLPERTSSFQEWANQLKAYANSKVVRREVEYWGNCARTDVEAIPRDFMASYHNDSEANAAVVTRVLNQEETRALLQNVPSAYRTQVNDVLLTALLKTISEWGGCESIQVDLEGHGREEVFDQVSLSRTLGWFTSIFPVLLHLPASKDTASLIKSVKEQLRKVPNRGLGYGVLRYLSSDSAIQKQLASMPKPEISFNYLGQVDLDVSKSAVFSPALESRGAEHGASNQRGHVLDLIALVSGGELKIQWIYGKKTHRRDTVEALADKFVFHLRQLIEHCLVPQNRGCTPSDFPLTTIDQTSLDSMLEGRGEVENIFPLSPLQEGLLYHAMFDEDVGLYNQQITTDFDGLLNLEAFDQAWQSMIQRHGVFRTGFHWGGDQHPLQYVEKQAKCPTRYLDWRETPKQRIEEQWQTFLANDRAQPFDCAQPPLMRLVAVRIRNDYWRLVWSHHHLLLDGWSLPIVFKELLHTYACFCNGEHPQLPNPRSYADYIGAIQVRKSSAEESFWHSMLEGLENTSRLGISREKEETSSISDSFAEIETHLSPSLSNKLKGIAQTHRLTLNTILQGMWGLLLSRYTGSRDVVFGVTVSGRAMDLEGIESMVGLFINTLPLRLKVDSSKPILDYLRSVQSTQTDLSAFEHSRLSDVQKWSGLPSGQALLESILVFENYPIDQSLNEEGSATFRMSNVQSVERTNFPLAFYVTPGECVHMRFVFQTSQLRYEAMERVMDQALHLLEEIVKGIQSPVSLVSLMSPEKSLEMLEKWNQSHANYDVDLCVHDRFQVQALKTPNRLALISGEEQWTYGELNDRSNQLAHYLQKQGVQPETLVGLYVNRSPNMLVGLLGILKMGAAYLPMDPSFPANRLSMMLEDSATPLILSESGLVNQLPPTESTIIKLDEVTQSIAAEPVTPVQAESFPEQSAYVIFTSGSTGRPKGVQIPHRALTNFLISFQTEPGLVPEDVLVAVTTLSFDIAALELFLPLITGARLVLADREVSSDGYQLANLMSSQGCTVMQGTPATWKLLRATGWMPPEGLRIWCGGEAFPSDLAASLLEGGNDIWNLYGPTETTIWSSIHHVLKPEDTRSIGHAIANTQLYVLDHDLNLLPIGGVGELYIGGDGLAHGYWNRSDLTVERFIPDPYSLQSGARLYRTGDKAKFLEDGTIEFLGRLDHQVKIRGFRVELGDIESAVRTHAMVRDCVVIVREDQPGQKQLVAYFVPANGSDHAALISELRNRLSNLLPHYMTPGFFVPLGSLPLTPNNKIDRRTLPAPDATGLENDVDFMEARDSIEKLFASVWADILKLKKVSIQNSFFEMGGDSLLAAQVLSWIRKVFHVEMSIRRLFEAPSIEKIVMTLRDLEKQEGQFDKIAKTLLRIRAMTPEERSRLKAAGRTQSR